VSAPPGGGGRGGSPGGASGGSGAPPGAVGPGVPRVRRIRADEGPVLRDVRLRALADAPLVGSTHARELAYSDGTWAAWAADSAAGVRQALFLAVGAEETAVGVASGVIGPEDPQVAHLYAMWVAPEARAAGAGAALVEAVVGWAAANGARLLRTAVTVGNDGAARLYERSGFRATGEREPLGHSDAEVAVLERRLTRNSAAR
jgi:ribosomal protein S18 acetylase RimI-like enzyme